MLRRHQTSPGHVLAGLYREHATAAYRYALHLAGSQDDAEDLVQSAFLEAHRFLARGGEIVNARAWLATVVRTRALNLRRDRRETAASDRLETLAGALEQDAAGAARAELDRVRAVLYELPEMQHQAFVLRYWSDLSYREIASVLETTESAVESLLVRARAAIVSGVEVSAECLEVRRLLSAGPITTPAHMRHLGQCAGCSAARTRLARAAGIAAAAAVIPQIHVAQALAATVPGFTTSAATASVGIGGTTLAAGKTGMTLKAAVAALALAGSAAIVHTHVVHGGAAPIDPRHAPSAHAPTPPTSSGPTVHATQPTTVADSVDSTSSQRNQNGGTAAPPADPSGGDGGVQTLGPTGQGSNGGTDPQDDQGDDSSSPSGTDTTVQDSGGNDDTQSAGASQDNSTSQDGTSTQNGATTQNGSGNNDS